LVCLRRCRDNLIEGAGMRSDVAAGWKRPRSMTTDPLGKAFRLFASRLSPILRPLRACLRGSRRVCGRGVQAIRRAGAGGTGNKDDMVGSRTNGRLIPGARASTSRTAITCWRSGQVTKPACGIPGHRP